MREEKRPAAGCPPEIVELLRNGRVKNPNAGSSSRSLSISLYLFLNSLSRSFANRTLSKAT